MTIPVTKSGHDNPVMLRYRLFVHSGVDFRSDDAFFSTGRENGDLEEVERLARGPSEKIF